MAIDKCDKNRQSEMFCYAFLQNKAQKGTYMDEISIFQI